MSHDHVPGHENLVHICFDYDALRYAGNLIGQQK